MMGAPNMSRCWIIIPRFSDFDVWRSAIQGAAAEQGLRLTDVSTSSAPGSENRLLLADDPSVLAHTVSTDKIVLLLTAGALEPPAWQDGSDQRQGHVRRVTDQICRAMNGHSIELKLPSTHPGASLELFPGLSVVEPRARADTDFGRTLTVFTDGHAFWPAEMFTLDPRHVRSGGSERLDVTGKPRFLVFGPYVTLPAGRWKATFRLSFDEAASRMNYWLDWGGTEHFARAEARPGRPGVYEVHIEHESHHDEPFELRVVLTEGAFHGAIEFNGAEISKVG